MKRTLGQAKGGQLKGIGGAQSHFVKMSARRRRKLVMEVVDKSRAVQKKRQKHQRALGVFDSRPRLVKVSGQPERANDGND